jgi:O-6-methylguanine DNA methyltransferase
MPTAGADRYYQAMLARGPRFEGQFFVGVESLSIVVPCHRVIGAGGKLVGFAGGLEVKAALLRLEGYLI